MNVVDGCIPSDLATGAADEIEEERRLLYVAMTRAKDELNLIVPQRFYTHQQARTGDRHVFAGRSRFIPAALAHHFNRVSWPIARQAKGAAPTANRKSIFGAHARHVEQDRLTSCHNCRWWPPPSAHGDDALIHPGRRPGHFGDHGVHSMDDRL